MARKLNYMNIFIDGCKDTVRETKRNMDDFALPSYETPTNQKRREKYLDFTLKSVSEILTPSQRSYILSYYIDNQKMKEIAEENSVNVATVSRTIKRGLDRIKKIAGVYF